MKEVWNFFARLDFAIMVVISLCVYIMRNNLREWVFQKSEDKKENYEISYKKILYYSIIFIVIFSAYLLSVFFDLYTVGVFKWRYVIYFICVVYTGFIVYKLFSNGYTEIVYVLLMGVGANVIGTFIYTAIGLFFNCIKTSKVNGYVQASNGQILVYILFVAACIGFSVFFIVGEVYYLYMIYKIWEKRIGKEGIKKIQVLLGISVSVICAGIINFLLNFSRNLEVVDKIARICFIFKMF